MTYLARAGRYWGQSGIKKTLLVLPKGYRTGKPIPVVMGMQRDATRLRALGAEVFHKPYAEQQQHSFSPDFDTALPIWIRYILGTGPRPR
ncbi:hypothetical protein [Sorangium sp. So ce145]|uniref:hypothetical protein n=1 Tax=Sorangium sp. So ce145 TaxID=3133285 RepID=UPI003F5E505C